MKLEKYMATYENEIVASGKTVAELKERLKHVQVSNIYPSYNIFELGIRQIDRSFIPREHTPEELKTVTNDPKESVTLTE